MKQLNTKLEKNEITITLDKHEIASIIEGINILLEYVIEYEDESEQDYIKNLKQKLELKEAVLL